MKFIKALLIGTLAISTTGCVGLFVAGAATTVTVVTDNRSTKEIWNDNNIQFEVAGLTNKAPYTGQVRINASAYNGIVVLMGQANTQQILNQFEGQARKVPGVTQIHNQVRIQPPLSLGEISHDSWVTTKVKSALLTNETLSTVKIKVITEDGEVFLLGYVSRAHADEAAEVARNISGVKQVIKAFQYGD
ncbi:BON domain-containing protein [Vibrio renipiscarius]|uniref:Hemolysin n=1 Tax=Vibrio renipiscarius TaxID=1461322 RepID=A0A0C2P0D0_9VIBR|nr:BON domain-containing protein [Vibrio renipiscarius]KII79912.1 hemolysin [Vibrio renipiscarius]KII80113.1 hemolysin [Vibrio renipiscarius]